MTINSQIVGSENSLLYTETQLDYAWVAGIVDGEGNIGSTQKADDYGYYLGNPVLRLSITQASDDKDIIPEMLLRIKNIFSTGNIYKKKSSKHYKKQQYVYYVYGRKAERVIRLIWFRLGEVKKEQAIKAGFKL